jgi:hypothetical protein
MRVISVSSIHTPDAAQMSPASDRRSSNEIVPTMSQRSWTTDVGGRRKAARSLSKISQYLSNAAPDRFDDSEFKTGKAVDFPEIPGEERRNIALPQMYVRPLILDF